MADARTNVAGGGVMAPCCAEPANREPVEGHPDPETWSVARCRVCDRKHYTLHADPTDWLAMRQG